MDNCAAELIIIIFLFGILVGMLLFMEIKSKKKGNGK
jgi:hypothetical protein